MTNDVAVGLRHNQNHARDLREALPEMLITDKNTYILQDYCDIACPREGTEVQEEWQRNNATPMTNM